MTQQNAPAVESQVQFDGIEGERIFVSADHSGTGLVRLRVECEGEQGRIFLYMADLERLMAIATAHDKATELLRAAVA